MLFVSQALPQHLHYTMRQNLCSLIGGSKLIPEVMVQMEPVRWRAHGAVGGCCWTFHAPPFCTLLPADESLSNTHAPLPFVSPSVGDTYETLRRATGDAGEVPWTRQLAALGAPTSSLKLPHFRASHQPASAKNQPYAYAHILRLHNRRVLRVVPYR